MTGKAVGGFGLYRCVTCGSVTTAAFQPNHINPARSGKGLKR